MIESVSAAHLVLVAAAVVGLAAVVHWLITITEGAYLGKRVVGFLYDRDAPNYERIKAFDRVDEVTFLANPLYNRLEPTAGSRARILDVATGTARLPVAVFDLPYFEGDFVGVDISRRMLEVAVTKTAQWSSRCTFLHAPAAPLPLADESFDAAAMLEALEFLPDRRAALDEMVRVLRPGGWLMVTNRIGLDARLMPGKVDPPEAFEHRLARLGLVDVQTRPWMVYYALVFARKPGTPAPRSDAPWHDALLCPRCGAEGSWNEHPDLALTCRGCGKEVGCDDGIWLTF